MGSQPPSMDNWIWYWMIVRSNQDDGSVNSGLMYNIYWLCYYTVHVFVIIHFCDCMWSFSVEASMYYFLQSFNIEAHVIVLSLVLPFIPNLIENVVLWTKLYYTQSFLLWLNLLNSQPFLSEDFMIQEIHMK
jgi:hypothetical protein